MADGTYFCPVCGKDISGTMPASPQVATLVQPRTSGMAIGSLVCGLFLFVFPLSVVAVILGHLSLSEIRRSAGRTGGYGMAVAGLVLGYLGLAVVPTLIIAAIAIPNLLRARIAANESTAANAVRTLNTAEVSYRASITKTQGSPARPRICATQASSTKASPRACAMDISFASKDAAPMARSGQIRNIKFLRSRLHSTEPEFVSSVRMSRGSLDLTNETIRNSAWSRRHRCKTIRRLTTCTVQHVVPTMPTTPPFVCNVDAPCKWLRPPWLYPTIWCLPFWSPCSAAFLQGLLRSSMPRR